MEKEVEKKSKMSTMDEIIYQTTSTLKQTPIPLSFFQLIRKTNR